MLASVLLFHLLVYVFVISGNSAALTNSSRSEDDRRSLIISCVGDSITYGMGSTGNKQQNAYPAILKQNSQFSRYKVHNFGEGKMCMIKSAGKFSYWNSAKFAAAMHSRPNIVIIMLGTNDAKKINWNPVAFRNDYIDMIRGFQNLESKPVVYISIPPPIYSMSPIYGIDPSTVNIVLPKLIPEIARACKVKVINNFDVLGGVHLNVTKAYLIDGSKSVLQRPNDGCHLSDFGYSIIAKNVANTLLREIG